MANKVASIFLCVGKINDTFSFSSSMSSVSDKGKRESFDLSDVNNKAIFTTNYKYWNQETGLMSVNNFNNEYFREIVDMGIDAVPYILEEIEKKPSELVHALDLIFPNVVKYDGFVSIKDACKIWISILRPQYHSSSNFTVECNDEKKIRHDSIINSFRKYCEGFPKDKENYISVLADTVSDLDFIDNVSSYNQYDESIDTILKLKNGLTLSISQLLSDDIDAPVVFSIHRNGDLLVSDEMPIKEIVDTINSIKI